MRLLSLDPSSSALGWAVLDVADGRYSLGRFGVIRPPAKHPASLRIVRIILDLQDIVTGLSATDATIEWSQGKTHGRISKASGLAVLGQAQGAIWWAVRGWGFERVHLIGEEWTSGRPKRVRTREIALRFPEYRAFAEGGGDPGMDAADAIGLGDYWVARGRVAAMVATAGGRR